jgi:type IV secretion system protein VirB1
VTEVWQRKLLTDCVNTNQPLHGHRVSKSQTLKKWGAFAMLDALLLAQHCASQVHPNTVIRVIRAESQFNPYAIGVVGGRLERQPRNLSEAVATAKELEKQGYNFSVGLMQVNKKNFQRYGLTIDTAFQSCENIKAGAAILQDCFERASIQPSRTGQPQAALRDAFSCYYSGNFKTGYDSGYVLKVVTGTGTVRINTHSKTNRYAVSREAGRKGVPDDLSAMLF